MGALDHCRRNMKVTEWKAVSIKLQNILVWQTRCSLRQFYSTGHHLINFKAAAEDLTTLYIVEGLIS